MSEQQKHTKTPWAHEKPGDDNLANDMFHVVCGDLDADNDQWMCVARFTDSECSDFYPDTEVCEANAARIVACVNACEGIADPSVVPELLEACKSALALIEISTDYKGMSTSRELRAAIAKATQ